MNYLMNYKEYGDTSNPTIMLIHGEFLSAWNYDLIIDQLKDRYHILLPLLDGHQGSKEHFISIEHIAKKIIEDINNHYDGQLALIGGLSLGGQILCEMLSIKDDICQYAIIESADVM
ncbi:MAG TPA: alpha/beta hydrolase, partial [Kandleria vitulina]|nr:alpha/beta hydrolase [Kandleria vitulina]